MLVIRITLSDGTYIYSQLLYAHLRADNYTLLIPYIVLTQSDTIYRDSYQHHTLIRSKHAQQQTRSAANALSKHAQ